MDNPVRRLFANPADLAAALDLSGAETVLELGPGSGFFSREVAGRLPRGRLELFDIQPEMLANQIDQQAAGFDHPRQRGFPDPDRLGVDELRELAEPAGFRLRDAGGTIVRDIVRFDNI